MSDHAVPDRADTYARHNSGRACQCFAYGTGFHHEQSRWQDRSTTHSRREEVVAVGG